MQSHSVAEASDKLSELIDRALAGEGVVITRDGHPVVELKPLSRSPRSGRRITPEDIAWLDAHRIPRITGNEDAGTIVSKMRDEDER
jgi:prevent-host-death family protein